MAAESTNAPGIEQLEGVSVEDASRALGDFVLRAAVGAERFRITRYNKAAAGLISVACAKAIGIDVDAIDQVPQTEAGDRFGNLVIRAAIAGDRFLLTRYGNDSAVVCTLADLERSVAADGGIRTPDAMGRQAAVVGDDRR